MSKHQNSVQFRAAGYAGGDSGRESAVRQKGKWLQATIEGQCPAFDRAVDDVSDSVATLLNNLVTDRPSLDREAEAAKAKARLAKRFA